MNFASIGTDVKFHSWPNGELLRTYKSKVEGSMKSLSWGKDGSWLVLVPSKGPAEVISIRENVKHLHSIHEIQQPTCAAFQNCTKRNIAIGTTTGMVLIYDIKLKSVRKRFPKAPSTVSKIEYFTKDSFLVAACENGEILLYNSITFNLSSSYKIPNSKTVSNIRCHPIRRNLVVGGSQEGAVAMWDIHTSKLKFKNQAHFAPVTDLTFSPLRSDLLVTVGLDRKLMFFEANSNECIMQKVMDGSSTAIDFCPDGIGLAVALQDGTIQTYDTRQMNNPLCVFTAHDSQIKQLLFQKKAFDESSEFILSGDKVDSNLESHQSKKIVKVDCSYDSPGLSFCGDFLPDIPEAPTEASTEEDSFLEGLRIKLNKTSPNSLKEETADELRNLPDMKANLLQGKMQGNSSNPTQQINEEKTLWKDSVPLISLTGDGKAQTSTPKFFQTELLPTPNAISQHPVESKLTEVDSEVIRKIVREELKPDIDALKEDLKFGLYDMMQFTRNQFLHMQIFLSKESIKVEDQFNKLKEEAEESYNEDILIEENVRLRNEILVLKNQLLSNALNNAPDN